MAAAAIDRAKVRTHAPGMADNGWVLVAVGIGGPLVGAAIAYLGARHTARPAIEQALTAKFSALVDRQEREIAKLEAVAADLEVMLIRLLAWADEVATVAERRNIAIPPRPRFDQQRRAVSQFPNLAARGL